MAKRSFAGRRVILTGASSGIGWYLATELVRAGAQVLVTARRADRLAQLRLSFGNPRKRLLALPGDITDAQHRQSVVDLAVKEWGGIDLLINNAGVGAIGRFDEAPPERLRKVFEVDFFAAAELTRVALPHLRRGDHPAICSVSSVLGHRAVPGKSEYCAAKFALRGWSESLRVELRPSGIDVITVSPSTTRSEFFDSLVGTSAGALSKSFGSQSPERVARRIMRALSKRKRDAILSPGAQALVWLNKFAPRVTDQLLLKFA